MDVVVPVHGAAEDLRRCLDSLRCHTDLRHHRLVVVDDASHDPAVTRLLDELEATAEIEADVLCNEKRLGFVGSVNRAMARSRHDILLLNSDTVVTAGWLEKMQQAAYSSPAVATVTPFSNDATICSLPRPLEPNELPAGYGIDRFAALVEARAAREYPRIPSGVGMCLYIKRKVIDLVGAFDHNAFGLGYGEENEFCLRALRQGYVHVLDDATFIYHAGERSFGASSRQRRRAAHRVLRRYHPEYLPTVARFLAEDPLAAARERVLEALRPATRRRDPAPPRRVLHLVHGWPPWSRTGTEQYARWLALHQVQRREVTVYARIADPTRFCGETREYLDHGVRVRLVVNNFMQRNPLVRNAFHNPRLERDFSRLIDEVRPELIHVHHLAGHAASLLRVATAGAAPVLYQVQDWWPLCARVNFTHRTGAPCEGPGIAKCSRCLPLTSVPPAGVWNRLLYLYRRWWMRRLLHLPSAYLMGSRFIERSYREAGLLQPSDQVYVRSYGVPLARERRPHRPPPGTCRPLRFGYVGSILPHKGVHLAVDAFHQIDREDAVLEIWGDETASPDYVRSLRQRANPMTVSLRGSFPDKDKAEVLSRFDALLMPSIGHESFGLVAREAMAVGTPVVAARTSALAEMVAGAPAWSCFDPGDAEGLAVIVDRLIREPRELTAWAERLPAVKSAAEHGEEVDEIYSQILRSASRTGGEK